MKPPKRERRCRVINGSIGDGTIAYGEKWTLPEKKRLLDGLKSCGPDNLEQIQREFLPARQLVDIKNFIAALKLRLRYRKPLETANRAPIEVWLDEAEQLTKKENDYSFVLADIFSVFGNLEPHDSMPHSHGPNWGEIYKYISAVLRGGSPRPLSPFDATIVLNLLDELAKDMHMMNTKIQRLLMKQKFGILRQAGKAVKKIQAYRWAQTALERDPFEKKKQSSVDHQTSASRSSSDYQTGEASSTLASDNSCSDTAGGSKGTNEASSEVMHSTASHREIDGSSGTETAGKTANRDTDDDTTGGEATQASSIHSDENDACTDEKQQPESTPSNQQRFYTLNPFCIPVKYLNLLTSSP